MRNYHLAGWRSAIHPQAVRGNPLIATGDRPVARALPAPMPSRAPAMTAGVSERHVVAVDLGGRFYPTRVSSVTGAPSPAYR